MPGSKKIILKHYDAINEQDVEKYLETVKYPFTYQNFNGVSITIENPGQYKTQFEMPWDIIRKTEPGWSHSVMDQLEEIARSSSSVVYKFTGRRINQSGNTDTEFQAIWIAVRSDDKWGVQFRHNLGRPVASVEAGRPRQRT